MKEKLSRYVNTQRFLMPVIILLLTFAYFFPIITHLNSYIPGGDAMFNAYLLSRNHHCMLGQNCDDYSNANIYYPNKDTMLYSETEIAPSVISFPLRLITENPILPYNVMTIASFFMAGLSMYLLALYLTRGNKPFSLVIGLIFEFSPVIVGAVHNLQSLSIFCLPLVFLWILKYLDGFRKRYLLMLFVTLLYVFYASWYQMIFVLLATGILLVGMYVLKMKSLRSLLPLVGVISGAVIATLPLALQYLEFARQAKSIYKIEEKIANSSTLVDYIIAPAHSIAGSVYRDFSQGSTLLPNAPAYFGVGLSIILFISFIFLKKKKLIKKRDYQWMAIFGVMGGVAFIASLGPLLKITNAYIYTVLGEKVAVLLPFYVIHEFIKPLSFIRAPGRLSVICIFVICCALAVLYMKLNVRKKYHTVKKYYVVGVVMVALVEIFPIRPYIMDPNVHAISDRPPAVYEYIKNKKDIDSVIVLQAKEYPNVGFWFARTEVVLWAGYHNKNVFNGYSGYIPPTFESDYSDFVNLDKDDPSQMKSMGINYVVLDTELYSNKPHVLVNADSILGSPIYKDERYKLYKLN